MDLVEKPVIPATNANTAAATAAPPLPTDGPLEKRSSYTQSDEEKTNVSVTEGDSGPKVRPPDCAYGWIPTLAVCVNYMFMFGASNSYGVFSTYYLNERFVGTPATTLAWIGTLIPTMMLGCNIVTGALADKLGFRRTAYVGTVLCSLAYILASFATQVWQLILTQGVLFGVGASFLFAPSVSIPPQWFVKYRGIANGVAVAGSSFGGLWFTAATQAMLDNLGAQWALRILGILTFVVTGVMNVFYVRRVPAKPRKNLFELKAFGSLTFWLVAIEGAAIYVGYWAVTFYVGTAARQLGGTSQDGSNLLLALNAGSAIGRITAGYVADKAGNINTLVVSDFLAVVIQMAIWMTAKSIGQLYALCILYGMFSPTFISINPVIVATYFDQNTLASVMGMANMFAGIGGLAGNLSQGYIVDHYDKRQGFNNTIIFSAMFILFSGIVVYLLRVHVIRKSDNHRFLQKV